MENALIALSLLAGFALLAAALYVGDATAAARAHQWQLVFAGLSLALAGQWIVGGSPAAKKQQIAGASVVLAAVGLAFQYVYGLGWAQSTPFIVSYLFLFLAAETCYFFGSDAGARRNVQYLRAAVVVWNLAWGAFYLGVSNMQLPDVVNLFIAFSWLWTAATAIVGWSEFCNLREIQPDRARPTPQPPPQGRLEYSTAAARRA